MLEPAAPAATQESPETPAGAEAVGPQTPASPPEGRAAAHAPAAAPAQPVGAAAAGPRPPLPRPPPSHGPGWDEAARAREAMLVSRLRRGDDRAFAELVRTHQDRVFDLTYRMLGDRYEAEDLAQEIFVAVHRALPKFRGESRLSTWLFRVARNHCLNRLKYLGRRGSDGRNVNLDDAPDLADLDEEHEQRRPDRALEQRQTQDLVQRAIRELSEEHRVLVVLRDIEGLSYDEIMEITEQPEGTVKSRLHRARAALALIVARIEAEAGKGAAR